MIRLSKSQVLLIHEQLIAETGGSSGLRDEGMLDSALNAPFQTFGGEDVYPSLQQKAARLCFGLVKNHPFADAHVIIGTRLEKPSKINAFKGRGQTGLCPKGENGITTLLHILLASSMKV